MEDNIEGFESDIQEKEEQNSEEGNIDSEDEINENNIDEEDMNENNNDEEEMNENISDADESENEGLNHGRFNEHIFKYNTNEFEKENIIKILLDSNLIYKKPKCDKCQSFMNLTKNKKKLDGYMWRCKKKS